jgi:hypothetical protein
MERTPVITSREIFARRMLEKVRGQKGRVAPLEELISGPRKTGLEEEQSKLMTKIAAELVRVRGGERGRVKEILDRIDNVRKREEANGTEEEKKVGILGEELEKIIREREQREKAGNRLRRKTPEVERLRRETAEKADRLRRESLKRNRQRIKEQETARAGGQVQRIWNRYIRGLDGTNGYRTILDTTSTTGESLDQDLLAGYEPLIDPLNSVGPEFKDDKRIDHKPKWLGGWPWINMGKKNQRLGLSRVRAREDQETELPGGRTRMEDMGNEQRPRLGGRTQTDMNEEQRVEWFGR